jgi:hypothetical protein
MDIIHATQTHITPTYTHTTHTRVLIFFFSRREKRVKSKFDKPKLEDEWQDSDERGGGGVTLWREGREEGGRREEGGTNMNLRRKRGPERGSMGGREGGSEGGGGWMGAGGAGTRAKRERFLPLDPTARVQKERGEEGGTGAGGGGGGGLQVLQVRLRVRARSRVSFIGRRKFGNSLTTATEVTWSKVGSNEACSNKAGFQM